MGGGGGEEGGSSSKIYRYSILQGDKRWTLFNSVSVLEEGRRRGRKIRVVAAVATSGKKRHQPAQAHGESPNGRPGVGKTPETQRWQRRLRCFFPRSHRGRGTFASPKKNRRVSIAARGGGGGGRSIDSSQRLQHIQHRPTRTSRCWVEGDTAAGEKKEEPGGRRALPKAEERSRGGTFDPGG